MLGTAWESRWLLDPSGTARGMHGHAPVRIEGRHGALGARVQGLRPLPARPGIWAGWRLAERQPGSQQAVAAVYLEKSIQRRYKTSKTERISTRTGIAWKCKATGMGGHAGHTRQRYAAVWGTGQAGRAQGGCLGTKSRRKTRQAAKSCGEGHMPGDPQVSEWGNPHGGSPHVSMRQHITHGGEPGELKHLSSRRKRKKHRFPE